MQTIQSKAMKRAHFIYKTRTISRSNALRLAWKQVKAEADKTPVSRNASITTNLLVNGNAYARNLFAQLRKVS